MFANGHESRFLFSVVYSYGYLQLEEFMIHTDLHGPLSLKLVAHDNSHTKSTQKKRYSTLFNPKLHPNREAIDPW
jgi:hypothetical protein